MDIKKTKTKTGNLSCNEEKYRQIFELSPEAIVVLDVKGKILDVNNRLYDWLGYKSEEVIGLNILKVPYLSKISKVKVATKFAERMAGREVKPYELEFIAKNGHKRTGLIFGVPIENEKKKIIQDLVMISDITNRKQVDEKIKESEERFSSLFNNMGSGVVIYSSEDGKNFVIKDINKAGEQLTNTIKKDIIGGKVKDIFPGIEKMGLFSVLQKVYKTGKSQYYPTKLYSDKRLRRWYDNFVYRLPSKEIVAVFDDKTKKKQAEIDLKKNEEKLRINLESQELLANIAVKFNIISNFDKAIKESLEILGEYTKVSRIYVFEDSTDDNFTSNVYEWCNKKVKPQIDKLQDIPYETIPSWKKILAKKGMVKVSDIKDLPKDLYDILSPQKIKSILVLPIIVNKRQFGFVGFDDIKNNREWRTSDINMLETLARIIGNSYERKITQASLKEKVEELKRINDLMIGRELKMIELKKKIGKNKK